MSDRTLLDIASIASLIGLLAMIVFCDGTSAFMYRGGLFLASILSAIVIAAMVVPGSILGALGSFQPLVWIGLRSYGIYLWHFPILLLMSPYNTPSAAPWWLDIIALLLIIAISALSFTFVEDPIRHKAIGRFITQLRAGDFTLQAWAQQRIAIVAASGIAVLVFIAGFFAVPYTSAIEGADLLKDSNAQIVGTDAQTLESSESTPEEANSEPTYDENGYLAYDKSKLSVLWIGDSVSIRSLDYFADAFPRGTIDARVNRQFKEGMEVYQSYDDQGLVGSVVVLGLGTNGPLTNDMMDEMEALIGEHRHILFINNAAPDEWIDSNNEIIANAAARYRNITVLDWYSYSLGGEYFDGDGTHLTEKGAEVYVQLVREMVSAQGWLPAEASEPLPAPNAEGESNSENNESNGGDTAETTESESNEAEGAALFDASNSTSGDADKENVPEDKSTTEDSPEE